ncbi:MAG TPA: RodZ domain-containing protein [Stellaceae bacterium]|nr:RodZ domain-containing protein [Stellaceae bacterium]
MPLFPRSKRAGANRSEAAAAGDLETAASARPRNVGTLLREARQGFGRDIPQISAALRIRPAYLQAIEEGRYDALPGPTYTVGFIRAYSEYLGLDGVEMVRRFKQESEGLALKRDLSFPMPLTERSIPGGTILLFALILAICGYGLWYYLSSTDRARPERVGAVPSALLPKSKESVPPQPPSPTTAEASRPTDAVAAPPPSLPPPSIPPTMPAPSSAAAPAVAATPPSLPAPSPPAVPQVASVPPVPPPAAAPVDPAHIFGVTNGPSRIVIHATSDSWVQVRDSDQKLLFTRVMRAGEIYRAPDKPGLTMRVGNAAGIEVEVDGKPAPSLGGVGVVRHNVVLDPQKLLAGQAVLE